MRLDPLNSAHGLSPTTDRPAMLGSLVDIPPQGRRVKIVMLTTEDVEVRKGPVEFSHL